MMVFPHSYPVPRNHRFWHHFALSENSTYIRGYSATPFISHCKDGISEFHIKNASNNIWHSVKRAWFLPKEAFGESKSNKLDNRGCYSDYSCRGLFYSSVSVWFSFYCFVESVVFFTSSETSLHWSHRLSAGYLRWKVRLMHSKVLLYLLVERFRVYCYVSGLFW